MCYSTKVVYEKGHPLVKQVRLSALAICLGLIAAAPVSAEETGPSLEDTMEFLYDNMGETNGIVMNAAAGAGNHASSGSRRATGGWWAGDGRGVKGGIVRTAP